MCYGLVTQVCCVIADSDFNCCCVDQGTVQECWFENCTTIDLTTCTTYREELSPRILANKRRAFSIEWFADQFGIDIHPKQRYRMPNKGEKDVNYTRPTEALHWRDRLPLHIGAFLFVGLGIYIIWHATASLSSSPSSTMDTSNALINFSDVGYIFILYTI